MKYLITGKSSGDYKTGSIVELDEVPSYLVGKVKQLPEEPKPEKKTKK